MDLSVIVPCHNEESTLPEQLDALAAQEYDGDWEVVVVDNRSTDATAALVQERMANPDPQFLPWEEVRARLRSAG